MRKNLLIIPFTFLIVFQVASQTLGITPNTGVAQCPNEWITYTVSNSAGGGVSCTYYWKVTNGQIQGGFTNGNVSELFAGPNQVIIKWTNTTAQTWLHIAASCNPSSANGKESWVIPVKSIIGVNPSTISGNENITVNVTSNEEYEISPIVYPNKGSNDPYPFYVSSYEWEIPSGWTVINGGSTKKITVKPDNCSGGTIRVRGKSTACISGPYYTNWSSVKTVTRTIATPGAISGPVFVVCSDTNPVQFSVPAVTGATSYAWTFPSGWSGYSSTNSITLIPGGTNGGNVTVKAQGCNLESATAVKIVSLELFNPATPPSISGSSVVCTSGGMFTLNNVPTGAMVSWQATPSNLFVISSGTGSSANLTAANSMVSGQGTITFTINNACGTPVQVSNSFWVGKPKINSFTGPQSIQYGQSGHFNIQASGASECSWLTPYGWTVQLPDYFNTWITVGGTVSGTHNVFGTVNNLCNIPVTASIAVTVTPGGGGCEGMLLLSPNPSSTNEVVINAAPPCGGVQGIEPAAMFSLNNNVDAKDDAPNASVVVTDLQGTVHRQLIVRATEFTIDLNGLQPGTYIVRYISQGYTTEARLIKR